MEDQDSLIDTHIAILGLGLMGGSLALALKGHCASLLGYDKDQSVLAVAERMNIADRLSGDLKDVFSTVDLIILAVPVFSIIDILDGLPENFSSNQVIMDIGSTKVQVLEKMDQLPVSFDPIGGHPICGKEKSSLEHADAGLFKGAPFILCSSNRTSGRARYLAKQLIDHIGSFPVWMEAEEHDALISATSHVPYLLSNAMVAVTPKSASVLIGPGFRSTSRVAASSPQMMADVILSNQFNIMNQLNLFLDHVNTLREAIASGNREQVTNLLDQGVSSYKQLIG